VRLEEASDLHEVRVLKQLYATSSQLWHERDLQRGLKHLLKVASEILGAELATLHLVDPSAGRELGLKASHGICLEASRDIVSVRWKDDAACAAVLESAGCISFGRMEVAAKGSRLLSFFQSKGAKCALVAALPGDNGSPLGLLSLASRARSWSGEWPRRFAQECARLASDFLKRCEFECELREHADRYRQLVLGLSNTIVWEADPDTLRLTFVSPAAEALLGYPIAQWLTEENFWIDHIHPDDREKVLVYCRQEIQAGRDHQLEYRLIAADGRTVWLRDRAYVATLENGKRQIRGVMHDVTQEKEAELRLREGEERFRQMCEIAPVMIWLTDPCGRFLHANRTLREFWNIEENEVSEFSWASKLHPEDFCEVRQKVQTALATRSCFTLQARFRNASDEYRVLKINAQPRFSCTGAFLGFIGINVDLTNEIQAFEALRESEERFERFMHHLPGFAWIKDRSGRYVFANAATAKALDTTPDKLKGRTDDELLPAHLAAKFRARDVATLETGKSQQTVEAFEGRDGWPRYSLVSKFPIPDATGKPRLVGGIAIDVSKLKAAEEQIAKLNDDLRHRVEELEALLNALPIGVFIAHDPQCRQITMNPAGAAMLRLPLDANASKSGPDADRLPFRVLKNGVEVAPEDLPMQRAARTGQAVVGEVVDIVFDDGTSRVLYEHASPLFDASGGVRGCVGVFDDITERKRAEQQQQLLISELNHRVKNTLAITQSIASLTWRATQDPALFNEAFSARLRALAHAHSLLTACSWQGVSLRELILTALEPFQSQENAIDIDGPQVVVKPEVAVTLSLVLHELATNAAKHGALSTPEGCLIIRWQLDPSQPDLEFCWRETNGPPVVAPRKSGFGTRLIRSTAAQLGGTVHLDYHREGVEVRIRFPVEQARAAI